MKKLIAGLFAAGLMSAGLVAAGGTAAQADPYPGTVETTSKAKVPSSVRAGSKVALCGKVKTVGSNATAVGTLRIMVDRIGGGYSEDKTVAYNGGKVCITKKLKKPGSYVLQVEFESPANSVFNKSGDSKGFRVFRPGR